MRGEGSSCDPTLGSYEVVVPEGERGLLASIVPLVIIQLSKRLVHRLFSDIF